MSTCTTLKGKCPHGKGAFIWLGGGPWNGNGSDPDDGSYPWVHDTTMTPGHLQVCDLMPFATPAEAGEAPAESPAPLVQGDLFGDWNGEAA